MMTTTIDTDGSVLGLSSVSGIGASHAAAIMSSDGIATVLAETTVPVRIYRTIMGGRW